MGCAMDGHAAWSARSAGARLLPDRIRFGALGPHEVEIAVECCAVCHSDLHLIDGDWSSARFPLVPGHEVVGRIVAVGARVLESEGLALGTRVGVGWQCGACFRCDACIRGDVHVCTGGKRRTCVDQPGGMAERVRADARFTVPVPASLSSERAAPLFCAGLTVFTPLEAYVDRWGMQVGIVGCGGLGHLAVQIARAMGAVVTVFDPDLSKEAEARALGAAHFNPEASALDLILTTTSADLAWNEWMERLAPAGTLCLLGVPSKAVTVDADHLLDGRKKITGSVIGTPQTMARLLRFAVAKNIEPRVEIVAWDEAPLAIERVRAGTARYRMVVRGPASMV